MLLALPPPRVKPDLPQGDPPHSMGGTPVGCPPPPQGGREGEAEVVGIPTHSRQAANLRTAKSRLCILIFLLSSMVREWLNFEVPAVRYLRIEA